LAAAAAAVTAATSSAIAMVTSADSAAGHTAEAALLFTFQALLNTQSSDNADMDSHCSKCLQSQLYMQRHCSG
jgi:hypothetical protein